MFTETQIKEIYSKLLRIHGSVKDSEFSSADDLSDSDTIVVVQDGVNKNINLPQLYDYIVNSLDLNVTTQIDGMFNNYIEGLNQSLAELREAVANIDCNCHCGGIPDVPDNPDTPIGPGTDQPGTPDIPDVPIENLRHYVRVTTLLSQDTVTMNGIEGAIQQFSHGSRIVIEIYRSTEKVGDFVIERLTQEENLGTIPYYIVQDDEYNNDPANRKCLLKIGTVTPENAVVTIGGRIRSYAYVKLGTSIIVQATCEGYHKYTNNVTVFENMPPLDIVMLRDAEYIPEIPGENFAITVDESVFTIIMNDVVGNYQRFPIHSNVHIESYSTVSGLVGAFDIEDLTQDEFIAGVDLFHYIDQDIETKLNPNERWFKVGVNSKSPSNTVVKINYRPRTMAYVQYGSTLTVTGTCDGYLQYIDTKNSVTAPVDPYNIIMVPVPDEIPREEIDPIYPEVNINPQIPGVTWNPGIPECEGIGYTVSVNKTASFGNRDIVLMNGYRGTAFKFPIHSTVHIEEYLDGNKIGDITIENLRQDEYLGLAARNNLTYNPNALNPFDRVFKVEVQNVTPEDAVVTMGGKPSTIAFISYDSICRISAKRDGYKDWTFSTLNFTDPSVLPDPFNIIMEAAMDAEFIPDENGYISPDSIPVNMHLVSVPFTDPEDATVMIDGKYTREKVVFNNSKVLIWIEKDGYISKVIHREPTDEYDEIPVELTTLTPRTSVDDPIIEYMPHRVYVNSINPEDATVKMKIGMGIPTEVRSEITATKNQYVTIYASSSRYNTYKKTFQMPDEDVALDIELSVSQPIVAIKPYPEDAEVRINGIVAGNIDSNGYHYRTVTKFSDVSVEVRSNYYKTESFIIPNVEGDVSRDVRLYKDRDYCVVRFLSKPNEGSGAIYKIDGVKVTSLEYKDLHSSFAVSIECPGYQTYTDTVEDLLDDKTYDVVLKEELTSSTAELNIHLDPVDAEVSVNKALIGDSYVTGGVWKGLFPMQGSTDVVTYTVSKSGFKSYTDIATLNAGEHTVVNVVLEEGQDEIVTPPELDLITGTLSLAITPATANVSVSDEDPSNISNNNGVWTIVFEGRKDSFNPTIAVSKQGYISYTKKYVIANETISDTISLAEDVEEYKMLSFEVRNADTNILLSGWRAYPSQNIGSPWNSALAYAVGYPEYTAYNITANWSGYMTIEAPSGYISKEVFVTVSPTENQIVTVLLSTQQIEPDVYHTLTITNVPAGGSVTINGISGNSLSVKHGRSANVVCTNSIGSVSFTISNIVEDTSHVFENATTPGGIEPEAPTESRGFINIHVYPSDANVELVDADGIAVWYGGRSGSNLQYSALSSTKVEANVKFRISAEGYLPDTLTVPVTLNWTPVSANARLLYDPNAGCLVHMIIQPEELADAAYLSCYGEAIGRVDSANNTIQVIRPGRVRGYAAVTTDYNYVYDSASFDFNVNNVSSDLTYTIPNVIVKHPTVPRITVTSVTPANASVMIDNRPVMTNAFSYGTTNVKIIATCAGYKNYTYIIPRLTDDTNLEIIMEPL